MTSNQRERLKMRAVYMLKEKIFFFDENGFYQSINVMDCINKKFDKYCILHINDGGKDIKIKGVHRRFNGDFFVMTPSWYEVGCSEDNRIVIMALSRMKEGDSFEQFEEYLKVLKPGHTHFVNEIDSFICKIDRPIFIRSSDNLSPNTFDYIYVDVSILSENAMKERDKYLKDNIREISKKVAEKLERSREYLKYGVPINFLRVCRITLKRKSNVVQFVFELKL